MKQKRIIKLLVLVGILLLPCQGEANDELKQLIDEAWGHNPALQATKAEHVAAQARVPQASALDDPRIGFRASNLPLHDFGLNKTPMTGLDFTLAQKIPFPGKLGLRKAAARRAEQAEAAVLDEARNELRFQVAQTYYQLYRIARSLRTLEENVVLLDQLAQVAEDRYATNQTMAPDVFRAQTMRTRLENDLLQLQQEQETWRVQLNTLLNREATAPLKLRYGLPITRPPRAEDWNTVVAHRPLLQALDAKIEEADQRVKLARRDYLPDFDFMVGYRLRGEAPGDPVNGSDFISGGVSLNIPLWGHWRQSQKIAEQKAMRLAANNRYKALTNQATYEAERSYQELQRRYQQLRLFQTRLLPQARATFEASLTAYETSATDFFSTIEALKDRYTMERDYYTLHADYETSLERLKWVSGMSSADTQEVQP